MPSKTRAVAPATVLTQQPTASPVGSAPILRLDFDIMHTVFRSIFDSLDRENRILPGFRAQHARIAARVCRQWESFAAACPWLWTFIEFSNRRQWKAGWEKQKLYLERAAGLPLDISIRGMLPSADNGALIMSSIADLLVPLAPSWKSLRVGPYGIRDYPCPMAAIQVLLERMQGLELPILEDLVMHAGVDYDELRSLPLWPGPGSTPNLRHVMLTDIPASYQSSMFDDLRLLSVYDQRLANYPVRALVEYLVNFIIRSPDLTTLSFVAPPKGFAPKDARVPMPIPSNIRRIIAQGALVESDLGSLTVQSDSGHLVSLLLNIVQFPLLIDMSEVNDDFPAISTRALPALAAYNPLKNLVVLHIQGPTDYPTPGPNGATDPSANVNHLAGALNAMKKLRVLFLNDIELNESHVMALGEVCPALEILSLADCKFPSIQVWDTMVKERFSSGITALKRLELTPLPWSEDEVDSNEYGALRSLKRRIKELVYEWEGDEDDRDDEDDTDDDDDDDDEDW